MSGGETKQVSSLNLQWKKRVGGGGRTERDFLDFIIDGRSLHEQIGGDLVSCLGRFASEYNAKAFQRLLRKQSADLPNGRVSLFVCGECGDLGCGAISIVIERENDKIVWRDFGYENDYDGEIRFEDFNNVGPFYFDASEYWSSISKEL